MLLREIRTIFHSELDDLYPKEEVDSFFYLMLENYLNLERFVLALQPQLTVSKDEQQPLFEGLARLKLEEPIQYVLGEANFQDFTIKVNRHVLIPRPETEELVHWIISEFETRNSELKILDIGTGSGCIAIALAKAFKKANVYALDISNGALKIARENAHINKVEIEFFQEDILDLNLDLNLNFDIIVSNPPYVREKEKVAMQNNVKKYEPAGALYVSDENPLVYYDAIADFALSKLKENGSLYFEINQYLAEETKSLLLQKGFEDIILKKDIFGTFRMLKGKRP